MLASAKLDGLAQGLLGAALLLLCVAGSVPLALVHIGRSFAGTEASFRRLKTLWVVIGAGLTFSVVMMSSGGPDRELVPYLPVVILGPFIMAAAAWHASQELHAGPDLGAPGRWFNRLLPLAWLGVLAYFVVRVFPKM
jgi:hypothetical protein